MKNISTLLAIALVLTFSPSFGQLKNISVSLGGNYPFINSKSASGTVNVPSSSLAFASVYFLPAIEESFEGHAGLSGSGNFDVSISPNFFFSSGLSIDYYRFKKTETIKPHSIEWGQSEIVMFTNTGQEPLGSLYWHNSAQPGTVKDNSLFISLSDKLGETTTLYLSAPVMVGTTFLKTKLIVRAGLNFGILLQSSQYKMGLKTNYSSDPWTSTTSNPYPQIYEYKERTTGGYESFQISSIVKLSYMIASRWSVDLTSQLLFTNIYESNKTSKYKTLGFGASYRLK